MPPGQERFLFLNGLMAADFFVLLSILCFIFCRITDQRYEKVPYFVFGDFNFRLDSKQVIEVSVFILRRRKGDPVDGVWTILLMLSTTLSDLWSSEKASVFACLQEQLQYSKSGFGCPLSLQTYDPPAVFASWVHCYVMVPFTPLSPFLCTSLPSFLILLLVQMRPVSTETAQSFSIVREEVGKGVVKAHHRQWCPMITEWERHLLGQSFLGQWCPNQWACSRCEYCWFQLEPHWSEREEEGKLSEWREEALHPVWRSRRSLL